MKKTAETHPLRQQIAAESARLMMQEHIDDFRMAKQKAAQRLGITGKQFLPSNQEIELAVQEYQRLFTNPGQRERLQMQRQTALNAMRMLADFHPRLVGSVLAGTANRHSSVTLHVFCDKHEELALFLLDRRIPYQLQDHTFHAIGKAYPAYQFVAGEDIRLTLVVFPFNDQRWSPPDPASGKPMQRATAAQVEALLAADEPAIHAMPTVSSTPSSSPIN